jgi:hypothetical protein
VLSVAVLLGVAVYLTVLGFSNASARPEIENVCRSYIQTAVNFKMLPAQYRTETPSMPQSELDSYLATMSSDMQAFFPNDENDYKYIINQYQANLKTQAEGKNIVFSYTKKVEYFKNFDFNGNTVTVTITTNSSFDGTPSTVPGSTRTAVSGETTDTISLLHTGGGWKIVYADLQLPGNGGTSVTQPAAVAD